MRGRDSTMLDCDSGTHDARSIDQQMQLYAQAARLAQFGAWDCDLSTEKLVWTDGVYDLFEIPLGRRLKRAEILDMYVGQSRHDIEYMRACAILSGEGFSCDAQIRTYRGAFRWIRLSAAVVYDAGRPLRLYGSKQNITHEREVLARLQDLADRDPLTGLANRGLFETLYTKVVNDPLQKDMVSALVLIDIDRFKEINDGLGHAGGDECLRQVALRLRRVFADARLVTRIGGDEFAVLLQASMTPTQVAALLARAARAICKPVPWNGHTIRFTVSIGARHVHHPRNRADKELFADADAALYAAKAAGRDTVRIYGSGGTFDPAQTDAPSGQVFGPASGFGPANGFEPASGRLDRDPPGLVRAASFRT